MSDGKKRRERELKELFQKKKLDKKRLEKEETRKAAREQRRQERLNSMNELEKARRRQAIQSKIDVINEVIADSRYKIKNYDFVKKTKIELRILVIDREYSKSVRQNLLKDLIMNI